MLWNANAKSGIAKRLDPRAKALAYLLVTILVLFTTRSVHLLVIVVALGALTLILGLGRRWGGLIRVLIPTLFLFGAAAWFASGAEAAVGAILRLLALLAAGVLFFGTTMPEELGEALIVSGLAPQKAFLLEGTLRFVPTLGRLVHDVRDAQTSRGIRLDGIYLLRNGPALLAPVLIGAVRLANELAEALEARGFSSPVRTPLRDYRWSYYDWSFLVIAALATAGMGWLVLMG